jgi:hypothetical protein
MAGSDDEEQFVEQSGGDAPFSCAEDVTTHDAEVDGIRADPLFDDLRVRDL